MPKINLTSEDACNVFIKSMDDKKNYTATTITPEQDTDVVAMITTKLWDDGAPHTKFFDRDEITANFTFEAGKTYPIVTYSTWGPWSRVYWFANNIWYRLCNGEEGWNELIGEDEREEN